MKRQHECMQRHFVRGEPAKKLKPSQKCFGRITRSPRELLQIRRLLRWHQFRVRLATLWAEPLGNNDIHSEVVILPQITGLFVPVWGDVFPSTLTVTPSHFPLVSARLVLAQLRSNFWLPRKTSFHRSLSNTAAKGLPPPSQNGLFIQEMLSS